jgi:hypothetical protein
MSPYPPNGKASLSVLNTRSPGISPQLATGTLFVLCVLLLVTYQFSINSDTSPVQAVEKEGNEIGGLLGPKPYFRGDMGGNLADVLNSSLGVSHM